MKLYKSLLYFTAALTAAGAMTGCSEEATLDGADAVYLELQPTEIYLRLGDTIKVAPRVTNVNGDEIPTQVALSVDDETVAKILGDTAVVAVNGGQGKATKLRATLVNGQYAVTNVNVVKNAPKGIHPIDDFGNVISSLKVWDTRHAFARFSISPVELLQDYSVEDGTISAKLEGLTPCTVTDEDYNGELVTVETLKDDKGKPYAAYVTVHFEAGKTASVGKVSLSIGEGGSAMTTEVDVIMQPTFSFASFYGPTAGPDIQSMPYLDGRPNLGTLTMYIASQCNKVIDINSSDEVRVAVNIAGGAEENIKEAVKCYKWEMVQGGALLTVRDDYEIVPGHGFDAILGVRSGVQTGKVVYECQTPCITTEAQSAADAATEESGELVEPETLTLTLNYEVVNIKRDYPITAINLSETNVELDVNELHIVGMSVVPMASYAYQKVTAVADDPEIVELRDFDGYDLPIMGKKPGTTTIRFSAYNDSELVTNTLTVTVKDPVSRVTVDGNINIFQYASTTWSAQAYSVSGALMSGKTFVWESANPAVATVAAGVVTGVAEGRADIKAICDGVESQPRTVRVVAAPDAINSADGFAYLYDDGDDIVFSDAAEEGMLIIAGAYADGEFEGTYTLGAGSVFTKENASAPATGTLTITKGDGEYEYIITMNVNVNLSSNKSVKFAFNNGTLEYAPE